MSSLTLVTTRTGGTETIHSMLSILCSSYAMDLVKICCDHLVKACCVGIFGKLFGSR